MLGLALNAAFPGNNDLDFDTAWTVPEAQPAATAYTPEPVVQSAAPTELDDKFVLIPAGRFLMGSPETENWRIEDETRHEVSISFYIDPYETTQADYARLMGENPSDFTGDTLPVESISWLDAIRYANARSRETGLAPAYTIIGDSVTWDRSASGYRLPTEAEWEYACRAGTATPFNLEKSLDASGRA